LYYQLTLAEWRANHYHNQPDATQRITDAGFTPLLRFESDDRRGWYAEAGIGVHYLSSPYDDNGRELSTRFQFGSIIGVGYAWGGNIDIRLQVEHVSNGGIKEPNSGINLGAICIAHRF
jgi:hypothetical protein